MTDQSFNKLRRRAWLRPSLEVLERRTVPAVLLWVGEKKDGLWSVAANWRRIDVPAGVVQQRVPKDYDSVVFNTNMMAGGRNGTNTSSVHDLHFLKLTG